MKKQTQYYIAYEKDESGGYIASAPSIAGCVVHGKTIKEAYKNICSAIEECLAVIGQFHREVPKEPISPEIVKKFSFVRTPCYVQT